MDGRYPLQAPSLGHYYPDGLSPFLQTELYQPDFGYSHSMSFENMVERHAVFDVPPSSARSRGPPSRRRRRQSTGSEHVKHRRTRSGCFTCRQRRVKVCGLEQPFHISHSREYQLTHLVEQQCDETRPICTRCQKGKRSCEYPANTVGNAQSSSRSTSNAKASPSESPSASSGDDDDDDDDDADSHNASLPAAQDEVERDLAHDRSNLALNTSSVISDSAASSPTLGRSPVSTRIDVRRRPKWPMNFTQGELSPGSRQDRWQRLPSDVVTYLTWFKDNMSNYYHAFKHDNDDFLQTTFLDIALQDDDDVDRRRDVESKSGSSSSVNTTEGSALLYAITAFASYHHTIQKGGNGDGLSDFLSYYNRSISILQSSLKRRRLNVVILLTILQLATIEEFLGDWINLVGHQKAACQILVNHFTPTTILEDLTRRKIIKWYLRFDNFATLMSGGEPSLDREWYAASADFHTRQSQDRPDDVDATVSMYYASQQLLACDITILFASKARGSLDEERFLHESRDLFTRCADFNHRIQEKFHDPSNFVNRFPNQADMEAEAVTDYTDPNFLYKEDKFNLNFVRMDLWSIELLFKQHFAAAQGQDLSTELAQLALKKCKLFDAIHHFNYAIPGSILTNQASLGITSLHLPKEKKYIDWSRKKFVFMEQHGCIYPTAFRRRMADIWGEDVTRWWLPHDEGYHTVIRAVRDFIDFRRRVPSDANDVDVQDMSGLFRSLHVVEDKRPDQSDAEMDTTI